DEPAAEVELEALELAALDLHRQIGDQVVCGHGARRLSSRCIRGSEAVRIAHPNSMEEVGMPIAVGMTDKGATVRQYHQVMEAMGLKPGATSPAGAISHWAAQTDDGVRAVDIWESKEAYEQFAAGQVGPAMREAGITEAPEKRIYEIHNFIR